MAYEEINLGNGADTQTGDPPRTYVAKIKRMLLDLYGRAAGTVDYVQLAEITEPDAPQANSILVYAYDDSGTTKVALKDHAGTVTTVGAGGSWGNITGTLSNQTDLVAELATKQPVDSDLTAIAALSTTSYGRALLTLANSAALQSAGGLVIGTDVQAYSSVLDGVVASGTAAGGKLDTLKLGSYSSTSEADPGIWLTRDINLTGSGNSHGFADTTYFRRTGGAAYAAFDGWVKMVGQSYDHYASFQDRPQVLASSGSDVITNIYGLYTAPSVDTGVITNRYGAEIVDVTKTNGGTVTTQYGVYIDALTAATTNWAVYAAGATASYFGGRTTFATGVTITQGTANTSLISSTGGSLTGSATQAMVDVAWTWNTTGIATGLKFALTNTASNASSKVFDFLIGGSSTFSLGALHDTTGNGLVLGTQSTSSSSQPAFIASRNINSVGTGNAHGFVDISYFRRTGTVAYCSFDAYARMVGNSYDHFAGFQTRPLFQFASSGQTCTNYYGTYSGPSIDTGTVTNLYHHYAAAPTLTNGGKPTNQYGYYCEALSGGTSLNYAYYSAGSTASAFGGQVSVGASASTPAGGSTTVRLLFGSSSGFGIYAGSGAPTVSAGQGSLYLRSDGSSTSTRAYINTDGATTWTNLTAAA